MRSFNRMVWVLATVVGAGLSVAQVSALELLTNGDMEIPTNPPGWELQEYATNPLLPPTNTAEQAGFANQSGSSGLWLRAFQGLFVPGGTGNDKTNAVLSQIVPGSAGEAYTFSGWSRWETNYAGGVTTLAPTSPSGATASPTQTLMGIEFLNGSGGVIGSPVTLDLRTVQTNGSGWAEHVLNGVAPAGTANVRVFASALDMLPNIDPQQSAFFDNFSLTGASAPGNQLLQNNDLEVLPPTTAAGWDIEEGSAAQYADFSAHSGANGFWVRAYEGFPNPVNASVTQTVAGEAGKTYRFTGWSYFEKAYSGGVTVLDPDSPWGATDSTTQTMFEMAFLNAGGNVIGTPVSLDLRTVQQNDATWRQHALSGVAPAGTASVRVGVNVIDMYQNVDKPFQTANFDDFSLTIANPCDLNADGAVDAADAGIMFGDWGGPNSTSPADKNGDGFVDAADAGVMFEAWTGDPTPPADKAATAEYNPETGELKISSAGAVNVFVQSNSSKLVPLVPPPTVPVGLLTNNASRVGITNLGPIQVTNFSFGSIGKGLELSDLKLVYTTALGTKGIEVPASLDANAPFRYIPEPASVGLLVLATTGYLAGRRRVG